MTEDLSDQADDTRGDAGGHVERKLSLFSLALWGPDGPPKHAETRHGFVNDDGEHVSPIRQRVAIPPPSLLLSRGQMQAIALGRRPVWDDRWLAFMEDDRLFLHRSWTGYGIFEATFAAAGRGFVVTSALVEGDPYRYTSDLDLITASDELLELITYVSGEPAALRSAIMFRIPLIEAVLDDITSQDVDAIVNAASTNLLGREGVSGAIFHAAGPELIEHCSRLDDCPLGRAAVTPGYGLPAQWVIHTVGPKWRGGTRGEPVLLESCLRESLALADEVGAESVAFPAIATGAHGYPVDEAATTAVNAVRSASTKVREIRFVCFDESTFRAFEQAIRDGE